MPSGGSVNASECHRYHFASMSTGVIAILLPLPGDEQGGGGSRASGGHFPGSTGSSVPSSANSQTLSPFAEAANMLPAE